MTENGPLVSCVIPVYNGERYLAEAIASVLAQTYRPIELIVVDDGSTDGSAEVARSFYQVRYFYRPHRGLGAARNQGVGLARGSFFAFLDADDVWLPDKLTLQMAAFEGDPGLDVVFGYTEQFHSPDLSAEQRARTVGAGLVMPGCVAGTMLIRRESFFHVGSFATHWRVAEFVDWYARAMERGLRSLILPGVVMKRRLHAANLGVRRRDARGDYVRVLKASLDRRRKGGSV